MADVTRCRNTETNGEAELPTDALTFWKARGWEPITGSRTPEAADVERVDAENAAAEHVAEVVQALVEGERLSVKATLAQVGDDPDAAAAALSVEQSHESPRSTLVARLIQIAGDAGTTEGEN